MTQRPSQTEDISQAIKEMGARLRASRKARGLTQADMAALLGVSIPTYQQLEYGRGTSTLWIWVAACILVGLKV